MMLYIWLLAVFVLDRISKFLVTEALSPGQSVAVLGGPVQLTYVRNTGAAFGILADRTSFFIVITLLLVGAILWFYHCSSLRRLLNDIGAGLVVGGALGNLTDRLLWGFVVDFVDLRVWPVFNVADAAIVLGGVVLIVHYHRRVPTEAEGVDRDAGEVSG